jgi:hypothetical protein
MKNEEWMNEEWMNEWMNEWASERQLFRNGCGVFFLSSSSSPEPQTIALNFDDGTQSLKKKGKALLLLLLVSSCTDR